MLLIGNCFDSDVVSKMAAAAELLEKCGGEFEVKGYTLGLMEKKFSKSSKSSYLVFLYARLGLHRYNLLKGTKFEVRRITKYVKSTHSAASSYYITLDAEEEEPAGRSSRLTFQTRVSEQSFGNFILTCSISRIRGDTSSDGRGGFFRAGKLPQWPQENPFEKYYLVKKSELEDNDCIRLYLELAIATTDRNREEPKDYDLSKLEIVNVAIDKEARLNATLYIRYKDYYLGKNDDRIAIVRRRFDEDTGLFSIMGQTLSSETVEPKKHMIVGLVANEEEDTSLKGQNLSSENPGTE